MRAVKLFALAVAVMWGLVACSRSGTIPLGGDTADGAGGDAGLDGGGASTSDLGGGGGIRGSALDPADEDLLGNLVVYFEFDQSVIRSDFNAMLGAHGRYLSANPNAEVRLEGHADERGSREYNVGLGERRAQAVRQILLLQGAMAAQLSTVSYGEERPAVFGSDEESYSLNRRVEIVYR